MPSKKGLETLYAQETGLSIGFNRRECAHFVQAKVD